MTTGSLAKAYQDVLAFHRAFGVTAPEKPQVQDDFHVRRRAGFIEEEVDELLEAEDIVGQADAYIDIIYFAVGGLVELGIEPSGLWDIVQSANMSKLWPDGKPRLREGDGKILKPDGWVAPEPLLAAEVFRQIDLTGRPE